MNEKYRNIEDIYDNYNDVTPQYDEKESFKEDNDLDETLPESFKGKIDFLAADEEEAIEGYDKVLLALTDKKYEHIRKQLEIIRDEEVAHKEFLEKAINDLKAIYVDPSENRDDVVDLGEENNNKLKFNDLRPIEKNKKIIRTNSFNEAFKACGFIDKDFEDLKKKLYKNAPETNLGGNIYKFRWYFRIRGSKDARVIYVNLINDTNVYLLTIYTKDEKDDINNNEKKEFIKLSNMLSKELDKNKKIY